jgi:hypothetical protein
MKKPPEIHLKCRPNSHLRNEKQTVNNKDKSNTILKQATYQTSTHLRD